MNKIIPVTQALTRRSFLSHTSKTVAGAAALSALPIERFAHAASPGDTLKIALIGCGGRGSGAAQQALSTGESVKLVAAVDIHQDRLTGALKNLANQHKEKVQVPPDQQFLGFDGYKKAIALADVVILATPPGFRPMQFEEAVKQGKHVFTEKPVCVDATGFRRFMAAAEEAKKKNLKVGVGLQRHHQKGYIETMNRLWDGGIGDIHTMRAYWNGNTPWVHPRAGLEKQYGRKLTEMEFQLRNWYYFNWLCGDHIVEQHIHNLDVINWLKGKYPTRAVGMGGRQVRTSKDFGEIFDHHAVEFEYDDGSRMFSQCRQQPGCWNSVSEHVQGTKGTCDIADFTIKAGTSSWKFKGKSKDPYQQEHDDLFASIRSGNPINEGEYGALSTMTAIFGRMATYSGKELLWKDAFASNLQLANLNFESFADEAPVKPREDGTYAIPTPGITRVI